ncbi:MAG: 4-(cytidine 5'-diphospho)-2-C-methyl-D-erythritol kinase [Clostridiales bacterium]|nr:4-(cytidine 5'-diphospho)-2-C-methyl-D-erythritol kinase [Clostridiales bacterium]
METLLLHAPAKVNWRLKVIGRRKDGYHLLCGLMQAISLTDTIYISDSASDNCYISKGPTIRQECNLAYKAWQLLKQELRLAYCLEIGIEKNIPLGGGLGGGSADAAAVLKGANDLFHLGLSLKELCGLGLRLGADVPFCLMGGLAKVEGIGERLASLPVLSQLPLLLVNPGLSISTAAVFRHYAQNAFAFADAAKENTACTQLALALNQGDIPAIKALMENDLAVNAVQLCPAIGTINQRFKAIGLKPLLCGSGSTIFTLLENMADLKKAKEALADLPWVEGAFTCNINDK